jgi:8-oxo-dGTP pyrophosphatase MutT (NUDIX family)
MPTTNLTFACAVESLHKAQKLALPGSAAWVTMTPEFRKNAEQADCRNWREAAVLVLVYPDADQPRFILIERPGGSSVHAGQMALPGGARETGESFEQCAIRETAEELGIITTGIELVLALSPLYIPPSCFLVRPFVGCIAKRPPFKPAAAEVVDFIEPALTDILDPDNQAEDWIDPAGRPRRIPYYRLCGRRVWGATAMMLCELAVLLHITTTLD